MYLDLNGMWISIAICAAAGAESILELIEKYLNTDVENLSLIEG